MRVSVVVGSAHVGADFVITNSMFGVRYVSFDSFQRFIEQTNNLEIGHIAWPGGSLAEERDDRFGLNYLGLQSSDQDRPGLFDLIDHADQLGADLTIPLPTARYYGDAASLRSDVREFVDTLPEDVLRSFSGQLTFEIGNEYYANFRNQFSNSVDRAAAYGAVAEKMISNLNVALKDRGIELDSDLFNISIQMGRTDEEDQQIRESLSTESLSVISSVTHHRFTVSPEQNSHFISHVQDALNEWDRAIVQADGQGAELLVSAWGNSNYPRHVAKQQFETLYYEYFGRVIELSTTEVASRSNADFENFWQTGRFNLGNGEYYQTGYGLSSYSLGIEQAWHIVDLFAGYAEIGAHGAAIFGTDVAHAGSHSYRFNGTDHYFIGSATTEMLYESVGGTSVVPIDPDSDALNARLFENDARFVLFASLSELSHGDDSENVWLDLSEFGDFSAIWVTSLKGETLDNWQDIFGVPDTASVSLMEESSAYQFGRQIDHTPRIRDNELGLRFTQDSQLFRVTLLKGHDAFEMQEVSAWAGTELLHLDAIRSDGSTTQDILRGSRLDDVFMVDSPETKIIEVRTGGRDQILSSVDFSMENAPYIEELFLIGADDIDGFGDGLGNTIVGNVGNNSLFGGFGQDILMSGAGGEDYLYGGAGNDELFFQSDQVATLVGGFGDDAFFLLSDGLVDLVEADQAGIDTVFSRFDFSLNASSDNIERIELLRKFDIDATGNDLDNRIIGNPGDNILRGMGGEDRIFAGDGKDRVFGGGGDDYIVGGGGADTIFSGAGNDLLEGGDGADVFVFSDNDGRNTVADFAVSEDTLVFHSSSHHGAVQIHHTSDGAMISHAGTNIVLIGVSALDRIVTDVVEV